MATFLEMCAKILTEDNFVNNNQNQQQKSGANAQQNTNQTQNSSQTPPVNNQQQPQQQNNNAQKPAQAPNQNPPPQPIKPEDWAKDLTKHPISSDPDVNEAMKKIIMSYNQKINNGNAANK